MRCPSCGSEFDPDYAEGELSCPNCGAEFNEPDFEDEDEEEDSLKHLYLTHINHSLWLNV